MGLVLSVQGFRAYRGLVPDFSGGLGFLACLGIGSFQPAFSQFGKLRRT